MPGAAKVSGIFFEITMLMVRIKKMRRRDPRRTIVQIIWTEPDTWCLILFFSRTTPRGTRTTGAAGRLIAVRCHLVTGFGHDLF